MANKDLVEKLLCSHADVFADIYNVLLFGGRQVINPDDLVDANGDAQYKADDSTLHEMERDVFKNWLNNGLRISIFGMENQTRIEKYMPLRMIGYDGVSYRSQLLPDNKDKNCPVISIALYFGTKHWKYPKNLKGVIDIPPELEPFVNDYEAKVFEIAFLTDEQVSMFKSDFRFVAEYFVNLRKQEENENQEEWMPSSEHIQHTDEFLKFMKVFTGANVFDLSAEYVDGCRKQGGLSMHDLWENMRKKEHITTVISMVEAGYVSEENAAKVLNVSVEEVERLMKQYSSKQMA